MTTDRCRYCGSTGDLAWGVADGEFGYECWDMERCAKVAGMSREQILDRLDAQKERK